MKRTPTRRRQLGQAATEALVTALFFLVPLFLAIAALGKLLDVQHVADVAARYAAWERTVWYPEASGFDAIQQPNRKTSNEIANEIAARILSDRARQSVIRAGDRSAGGPVNGTDPLWQDHLGKPFFTRLEQLGTAHALAAAGGDAAGAVATLPPALLPPLPDTGIASDTIWFKDVARDSAVFARLWPAGEGWKGMEFTANGAIVSNTWAANGSAGTKDMVAKMVPTAGTLGQAVKTAVDVGLGVWDPANMGKLEVGKIAVDVVPPDRLKDGRRPRDAGQTAAGARQ